MINASEIKEHAEVVGADGVHVGTVDRVECDRIKLTKADNGKAGHQGHHHFIPLDMVSDVDSGRVRLSKNGKDAIDMAQEENGRMN